MPFSSQNAEKFEKNKIEQSSSKRGSLNWVVRKVEDKKVGGVLNKVAEKMEFEKMEFKRMELEKMEFEKKKFEKTK